MHQVRPIHAASRALRTGRRQWHRGGIDGMARAATDTWTAGDGASPTNYNDR